MKMYSKKDVEYKNGYIVYGNEVLAIPGKIVDELNKIDEDIQRYRWNEAHKAEPAKKVPDFVRTTEHEKLVPVFDAFTPTLDEVVSKAIGIMDDLDHIGNVEKAEDYYDGIAEAIEFVNNDYIVAGDAFVPVRFDLPVVGNPLELDMRKLCELVNEMFFGDKIKFVDE